MKFVQRINVKLPTIVIYIVKLHFEDIENLLFLGGGCCEEGAVKLNLWHGE